MPVVDAAERLAFDLLGQSGNRWAHTRAVAARATEATVVVPAEQRPTLVAAAWLHDIGYVASVRDTGFHPLDGARYLERRGWPPVIVGLVAHHSGARFVAAVRGLDDELADFADPVFSRGPLADALTWADQTTSSTGQIVDLGTRMADMLTRHGPDSPNALAHPLREPALIEAVAATRRAFLSSRLPVALAPTKTLPTTTGRPAPANW
jgi:hypothetical protein